MKHRWLARLIAAVVVPALLLALMEGGLRVCGYGYSTRFFEKTGDGKTLTTNPKFAWQYYPRKTATAPVPILFAREKAAGVKRIFVLGESAAAGTPDPAFGFARMLELMLRDQYPDQRCEVLNAAMRGIDSHIVRTIAAECAELSPDLFVIYMGNNEMIGLHAPSPEEFVLSTNVRWLRFKHALHRLKLMQLGESLLARAGRKEGKQDMEFFRRQRLAFDDRRRDPVYRNYEINLRDINTMAGRAGAQALVCSVAVNLHDFPPLASLHRAGLGGDELARWEKSYAEGNAAEAARNFPAALASYETAARLDDHFAELLFRMARCSEAAGRLDEARRHYSLARDWDAIQFRTDSRLNGAVRAVATNSGANVRLADLESLCRQSSLAPNAVPGTAIFQEHVHFRFEGDHFVAASLLPEVAAALKFPAPSKPPLSRDDCARQLAYTAIDDFNVRSAILHLTSNPPFLDQLEHSLRQAMLEGELKERARQAAAPLFEQALATYQQAVAARPDDWMVRYNFGNLLQQMKNHPGAAQQFAEVVKRLPNQRAFRIAYGNSLLETSRFREAAEQFEAALKLDSELEAAKQGLNAARGRLR